MPGRTLLLILGCVCALVGGCRMPGGDIAKDPLLVSRSPIEGSNMPLPRSLVSAADPVPPALPTSILVARLPEPFHASRETAAHTVSTRKQPVVATPAVRSTTAPAMAPADVYGHAPDLSWLQGQLERHHQGHFHVRFQPATLDAPRQTKVRLEDDPRLAGFRDGELVRVEGGAVAVLEPFRKETEPEYPRYRVRKIERIKER